MSDSGGASRAPGRVEVYVPSGAVEAAPRRLAPRRGSLRGAHVALLDNGKEHSEPVLDAIAQALVREHGVAKVSWWRKGYPAKGAPFLEELAASCDAVITGVGH